MKHLCAPFSLPNVDACTQGLDCSVKGSKMPKDNSETRVIKVEVPMNEAYPTVKVLAKWEVTDQTSKKAPKMFCFLLRENWSAQVSHFQLLSYSELVSVSV